MEIKYITYGGKHGPKMYMIARYKDDDYGWVVTVYPCDINGDLVSDPIAWQSQLSWWRAIKLFRAWYKDYDKYVNGRR